jgi:hypothetical protein
MHALLDEYGVAYEQCSMEVTEHLKKWSGGLIVRVVA